MNKRYVLAAGFLIVLLGGSYGAYDYFAGNHVEIQSVLPAQAAVETSGKAIDAGKLNGKWTIEPESQVYFSVTTSKETVNFAVKSVKGSWQLNTEDAAKNAGEGTVDLNTMSSGNDQRDNHIKGPEYLNVAQFPDATFTVKSFEHLPKEWKEGASISFHMTGTLKVKGLSKDVTFDSVAVYDQGKIKMEGSTVVTFADFGMKNPHAVVLDTQNDITVRLSLVLAPEPK